MKTLLPFSLALLLTFSSRAQITTPVVKAFFGVDADLKARYVNGNLQSSDDWYIPAGAPGLSTNGTYVIDTTGAAAVAAGYAADVSPYKKRSASFYRTMSKPAFTVVNNRLWLDALFVRDYHGDDTTVFASGSNKNGMTPAMWSCPVSQGIPDKNDILDMFMHVRRAGPNKTDSLWFFGGLSLDNVTGNRYFDFELYQTDIYYDRTSRKWYGFGPDAGHTSWEFDAAGNVTKPGDIIFSAEYQSSSLTNIEARIWINKASLSTTPSQFTWSGQFDGDGSGATFGYASIMPKTSGPFYTGLQSGNGEWAGPFNSVLQDNTVITSYSGKQFMEFSVNLSKLGLDPVSIFGSDICGTPFNRMVVKTRASASFTAELKDFVAPTDLFLAPRVDAAATVPLFCGNPNNVSSLNVLNPTETSTYSWATPNGHIVGNADTASAQADSAGMYIVTQRLMAGCSPYAVDTVYVLFDPNCTTMLTRKMDFKGSLQNGNPALQWTVKNNQTISNFIIERSLDGLNFQGISIIENANPEAATDAYGYLDKMVLSTNVVYYRLKVNTDNGVYYSTIIRVELKKTEHLLVHPNPANSYLRISLPAATNEPVGLVIYNAAGSLVYSKTVIATGAIIQINEISSWPPGMYQVGIRTTNQRTWKQVIVSH
jgi:hypothetical protein